jgi:hypothetical protein
MTFRNPEEDNLEDLGVDVRINLDRGSAEL